MFDNHKRFFAPGMFVRIRVPIGQPHAAVLVAERAIGSDQDQKFLYVLNDKNQVAYREVQTGALRNGLRVVETGLAPTERFIINGLQRVKSGDMVEAKIVDYLPPQKSPLPVKAAIVRSTEQAPPLAHDPPLFPRAERHTASVRHN
jgi:multidrug efflux system membrane fusion protein